MSSLNESDRDAILKLVRKEIRAHPHDAWMTATEAAHYLKMSKHHFLKLCRSGVGPRAQGASARLMRWKVSVLDGWMQRRTES